MRPQYRLSKDIEPKTKDRIGAWPKRTAVRKKRPGARVSSRVINIPYRRFIASLACVACSDQGRMQTSPTECAHVGERGLGQKCSDYETIPLCGIQHHRAGPESHHVLGKKFWSHHGLDKEKLFMQLKAVWDLSEGRLD